MTHTGRLQSEKYRIRKLSGRCIMRMCVRTRQTDCTRGPNVQTRKRKLCFFSFFLCLGPPGKAAGGRVGRQGRRNTCCFKKIVEHTPRPIRFNSRVHASLLMCLTQDLLGLNHGIN